MSHTLFNLGFPTTTAPWSYQHSLGISTKEIVDWWKTAEKKVDTVIADASAAGLGPTNAPVAPVRPVTPPSEGPSGTTILLTVLLVGGALGGFYYYKKNMKTKGKKA